MFTTTVQNLITIPTMLLPIIYHLKIQKSKPNNQKTKIKSNKKIKL